LPRSTKFIAKNVKALTPRQIPVRFFHRDTDAGDHDQSLDRAAAPDAS
jgi:hypothetical protein